MHSFFFSSKLHVFKHTKTHLFEKEKHYLYSFFLQANYMYSSALKNPPIWKGKAKKFTWLCQTGKNKAKNKKTSNQTTCKILILVKRKKKKKTGMGVKEKSHGYIWPLANSLTLTPHPTRAPWKNKSFSFTTSCIRILEPYASI